MIINAFGEGDEIVEATLEGTDEWECHIFPLLHLLFSSE